MYFLAKTVSLPPVTSPGLKTAERISQTEAVLALWSTPALKAMQSPAASSKRRPGVSAVSRPDRM